MFLLGWLIGCGGGPVDVVAYVQPLCANQAPDFRFMRLAPLDAEPTTDFAHPILAVGPQTLELNGRAVDANALASEFATTVEKSADRTLMVVVGKDEPAGRVVPMLHTARDAGVEPFRLVGSADGPEQSVRYADTLYATRLEVQMAALDSRGRQRAIANEMAKQMRPCEDALSPIFIDARARKSPEERCQFIAERLDRALPSCWNTDDAKVVTGVQMLHEVPRLPHTMVELSLSPEAEPFVVASDTPWAEVLRTWHQTGRTSGTWTIE